MRQMNGFMGAPAFGARLGQPTRIMVQAGGFRAFGTGGYFAAPPNGPMMPEPWQKDPEELGRGGGGGGGGRGGGGRSGFGRGGWGRRSVNVVNTGFNNEALVCAPGEVSPWCIPEEEFYARRIGMGQSRTQGVEVDPSAETLCELLKKALAANKDKIAGKEWNEFFTALNRLRPVDKDNVEWRAAIYHQMALTCPNEVTKLRSMPGLKQPSDKCVKLGVKPAGNIITRLTEPYQLRGWEIKRVPVKKVVDDTPGGKAVPEMQKSAQMFEIWACPVGDDLPKGTQLTPLEAVDLVHSLEQAIDPVRSKDAIANACVQESQTDLAVTENLLNRLSQEIQQKSGITIFVTQDEVDAAKKIVDCAGQLGAKVAPVPATVEAASGSGISPLATAGIIGGVGALTAFFVL